VTNTCRHIPADRQGRHRTTASWEEAGGGKAGGNHHHVVPKGALLQHATSWLLGTITLHIFLHFDKKDRIWWIQSVLSIRFSACRAHSFSCSFRSCPVHGNETAPQN
jgi:hypothetical protein